MRALLLAALALILLSPVPALAEGSVADSLAARGELGIPVDRARLLESELGQLFIINVDGFGYSGPLALEPGFAPLVEKLQIGGVIPHYGSLDYERIRRTNRALAGLTRLPLLICCDIVHLRSPGGRTAAFGDGYVGGFIGKYRQLPETGFQTLAGLNALVFKALGMNVALGPTIDDSTRDPDAVSRALMVIRELRRFAVEPVLKHFPFLPRRADLHRSSPDTRVPLPMAQERFAAFRELADDAPILMTTHLDDSLVDGTIVTFSPTWVDILRRDTGFRGLLMTDGLLMLSHYADRSMLGTRPPELAGIDPAASWAARAILAGHDLVIVEGSAWQTERAFTGVLRAACAGTKLGNELADRIQESYHRIRQFKEDNEALLSRQVDVPDSAVNEVIAMTPPRGADLRTFHFSAGRLEALSSRLAQTSAAKGMP